MSLNVVMNQQGGLTAGHNQVRNYNLNPQIKSNAVNYTTQFERQAAPMGKASAVMFRESGTVPYVMEGRNHLYSQQVQNAQPIRLETIQGMQALPQYVEQRQAAPIVVEQRHAVPMVVEQRAQPIVYEAPQMQRIIVQRPQHNFIESRVSTGSQNNQVYVVEIERLQMMLREKMEECERWKMQMMSQEAHSSQFAELQSRATYLQQENVRLTSLINEHIKEMDQWRRRCFELEGLRGAAIDKERLEAENRHLSTMIQNMSSRVNVYEDELNKNQQIKAMQSQEKEFYESELRRLSEMLEIKNREIADWVMRYQQTEFDITKSKDLEGRILILGSEIERLHMILKTNLEEMDNYHNMIASLESRVSQVAQLEARCLEQDAEIRRLRDTIEEWIAKYSKLELLVGANEGSEIKLHTLSQEVERLNSILINKQREIDELHGQLRISSQRTTDVSSYETKIALLSQEIERLNSINAQKESQLSQYLRYESEFTRLNSENERMRDDLQYISREVEEWRTKYSRLEMERNSSLPDYENKIALLTQEIERQKGLLKYKEEDLMRSKSDYERLEIRLREASASQYQITEYENKMALLSQEIERLNNMLRVKDEDISSWRARYDQLEVTSREHSSYKYKLSDYENKIALLSQEVERLNGMVRSKDEELYSFRTRYEQLEISSREAGNYRSQLTNYENKMALLSQEVERLNGMLRTKDDELYAFRSKYEQLEVNMREAGNYRSQLSNYENKIALLSQEVERLNGMMRTKDDELYSFRSKYEQLEINMREAGNYRSQLSNYENKIALLSQEVERLNGMVRSKDEELYSFRTRYEKLEISSREAGNYKSQLTNYENKIALLSQEVERLNGLLRTKESDMYELTRRMQSLEVSSREVSSFQARLSEYENKIALLSQEIERLNNLMRTKESDLYAMRSKYESLEVSSRELSTYQSRARDYENKLALLSQEVERLNGLLRSKDEEIYSLNSRMGQWESLQTETYSYKTKLSDYENRIALMAQEVERLTTNLRTKESEISELHYRVKQSSASSTEVTRLRASITEYENKMALLSQEVERLNGMIRGKESEFYEMKRTIQSLELSSREAHSYQGKLTEYENKIALLSQEVERLNGMLRSKESEIYEFRNRMKTLEMSSREVSSYQVRITEYENKMALLSQEVERLNTLMRARVSEIEEWKYKYSSLEGRNAQYSEEKMRYLVSEVDRLTRTLEENDRELSSYRSRYVDISNLTKKIDDYLMTFVLLCAEIENLRNKIIEKEAENETIRRSSFRMGR